MIPIMINDTPVDCINNSAITYHVSAIAILSVMKKENSRNGQAVRNKNGTYDLGVMQINEIWLPKIAPYGYTREDLQFNACKNVAVGAWLISRSLAEGGAASAWTSIANYHSRTQVHNKPYSKSIYANYQKLANITASS